ncbi:hypothetical protein CEXT_516381 [Caerostris extrusa]|uniref:Uncharacterized protein n=1 Tax=Caerostris extrusa TaxID=172846 RepID=A0AAV4SG39_CAEEX|nr:hypothetical protein CEXT_516381 [Caerostris extrusa]
MRSLCKRFEEGIERGTVASRHKSVHLNGTCNSDFSVRDYRYFVEGAGCIGYSGISKNNFLAMGGTAIDTVPSHQKLQGTAGTVTEPLGRLNE